MTKEDCIDALLELFDYAKKGKYIRPGGTGIDTYLEEKAGVLLELIHDRFDNFPLMFEELKEGMWVWDNKLKIFYKIRKMLHGKWFKAEYRSFEIDIVTNQRTYQTGLMEFEENRFYRKQVEE